jgi:hypothetical protein
MIATTQTVLGRAFDLYRRTATSRSAIVLVAANAIPLVGVLFFGWSLLTILVLFWIENGIVGLWNIPRILLARGSIIPSLPDIPADAAMDATGDAQAAAALRQRWYQAQARRSLQAGGMRGMTPVGTMPLNLGAATSVGMAVFFAIHYGIFWAVHGIFVFALPSFLAGAGGTCFEEGLPAGLPLDSAFFCASPFGQVVWSNVALAAVALFLSHGASFFLNYIGKREYLTTSPARQMFAPYGRVVVLHVTIIFGAFLIAFLGAPIGALLVLVIAKTAFDLGLHLREHHELFPLGTPPPAAATPSPT